MKTEYMEADSTKGAKKRFDIDYKNLRIKDIYYERLEKVKNALDLDIQKGGQRSFGRTIGYLIDMYEDVSDKVRIADFCKDCGEEIDRTVIPKEALKKLGKSVRHNHFCDTNCEGRIISRYTVKDKNEQSSDIKKEAYENSEAKSDKSETYTADANEANGKLFPIF